MLIDALGLAGPFAGMTAFLGVRSARRFFLFAVALFAIGDAVMTVVWLSNHGFTKLTGEKAFELTIGLAVGVVASWLGLLAGWGVRRLVALPSDGSVFEMTRRR